MAPARHSGRSRAQLCALAVVAGATSAAIATLKVARGSNGAFSAGAPQRHPRPLVQMHAEESTSSGTSVALVKVTEENSMTTASVLGGLAGLWLGGFWLGIGAFATTAYLARGKDDDLSQALKGTSKAGLEALNFVSAVNDKYEVSGKIGSAFSEAIEKADSKGSVKSALNTIGDTVSNVDKDIGIKDTLGALATSASELASQAVTKAIELNEQYKITDKIKEKIDEASKSSK